MSGNLTAPALYALRNGEAGTELRGLIDSEFNGAGGLPRAIELVNAGGGIEQARTLARCHAEQVFDHYVLKLSASNYSKLLKSWSMPPAASSRPAPLRCAMPSSKETFMLRFRMHSC